PQQAHRSKRSHRWSISPIRPTKRLARRNHSTSERRPNRSWKSVCRSKDLSTLSCKSFGVDSGSLFLIGRRPPWVTSGHFAVQSACPLYPRKRTCAVHQAMSALGHKQTSVPAILGRHARKRLASVACIGPGVLDGLFVVAR